MNRTKSKVVMVVPVVVAAVLGLVLSNLAMSKPPKEPGSPFERVEVLAAPQGGGAGFKPPQDEPCECPCECLDESQVRAIVRDEFDKQVRAEQVAPRTSIPGAVGYPSSTSPVVTSEPTTTTRVIRTGLFGARTVRVPAGSSSGTCRIVNGVRLCN